ncbi:TPR-like protein [Paxillus ammoniavirescens]|nr:TPR-like protein [Paxillus ammoniavirescens]
MASEKARVAKDQGNAAYKAAEYATAVGHYTTAILADSSDPTFFLNRAATYLKLGKNEDAERDCDRVLALSTKNVKALFRRGQARRALGKLDDARADFNHALALEPANTSVKNEILEIEESLQQKLKQRNKPTRPQAPRLPTPTDFPLKRRRVPIEIVETDTRAPRDAQITAPPETNHEALLQPISSRNLDHEHKPVTTEIAPPKPQTFVDAKQARETSKPLRVSGGIFRHTGNHTIVTRTQTGGTASPQAFTPSPAPSPPIRPPTTLFQFTKSWDSLRSDDDRWSLIRTIPPSSIPAFFQVSLEPELLKSILYTLRAILEQDPGLDTRNVVRDYLLAFTKVPRFGTVMLFMDKQERQLLELLRAKVNSS